LPVPKHMRCILLMFCLLSQLNIEAQVPAVNPLFVPDSLSPSTHIKLPRLQGFSKYYWNNNWMMGNIYLSNDEYLKGYYLRYDMLKNQIEVIIDNRYHYITHHQIDRFEWYNADRLKASEFINGSAFILASDEKINGFLEVLTSGELTLLKRKFVYALRESTSPTLVNDTDSEIRVFETYFLTQGENQLEEINGGRRKNMPFFEGHEKAMNKFIKDNNLRFNNEIDLITMVDYYNNLCASQ